MFKNRVRTAALAGAIAVATGVSGVAVPAFAEDTTPASTQGGGFNEADASLAKDAVADNATEKQLLDMTDATAHYIINNNEWEELYNSASKSMGDGIDLSENAQYKVYQEKANEATKQLAKAEANFQTARNSVNYALEVDKAADKAWAVYEEKAVDYNNTVTNIIGQEGDYKSDGLFANDINAANEAGKAGGRDTLKTPEELGFPIQKIDPENSDNVNEIPEQNIKNLEETIKVYKKALDRAGDRDADKKDGDYIPRDYVGKLETLIEDSEMLLESLKKDHAALEEAREAAQAASREAQKSDVLVRQGFLERAYAQVKVLRVLEASFTAGARELELRESNDNQTVDIDGTTPKPTLREAYFNLIKHGGILSEALDHNYQLIKDQEADWTTLQGFAKDEANYDGNRIFEPQVPADFGNPEAPYHDAPVAAFNGDAHSDAERNAYTAAKAAANKGVFGPNNYDIKWEETYKKVVNADNGVQADKKQREDDAQNTADLIKAVQDLANGEKSGKDADADNGKGADNGKDNGGKKDQKSSDIKSKLSSEDGKPTALGIFGIVAGILAAVAAAYPAIAPAISKALNIKLPF
ncbi:hypothetical protein [Corynebacterium sp. HMSC078H07]|uniref:hypothetical protein n=1 Tax=Corynebacterium sp. HMSC078H07 TaxID=1739379 RepID=UPI0008A3E59E|nr:hypothetical protein [Corynebacterium sp. HMSC078H07]OFR69847.1 hypothetical protein HMPREF2875_00190 [Corynebacterium sp. HMSC078H07]